MDTPSKMDQLRALREAKNEKPAKRNKARMVEAAPRQGLASRPDVPRQDSVTPVTSPLRGVTCPHCGRIIAQGPAKTAAERMRLMRARKKVADARGKGKR